MTDILGVPPFNYDTCTCYPSIYPYCSDSRTQHSGLNIWLRPIHTLEDNNVRRVMYGKRLQLYRAYLIELLLLQSYYYYYYYYGVLATIFFVSQRAAFVSLCVLSVPTALFMQNAQQHRPTPAGACNACIYLLPSYSIMTRGRP